MSLAVKIWNLALTFENVNFSHYVAFHAVFRAIFALSELIPVFQFYFQFQNPTAVTRCHRFPTVRSDSGLKSVAFSINWWKASSNRGEVTGRQPHRWRMWLWQPLN